MRVLLDTHVLLWWLANPERLSPKAVDTIADPSTEGLVSVVSIWEMVVKQALGKLDMPTDLMDVLQEEQFEILDVRAAHALGLRDLPLHHRDPFDRMLVSQCTQENCPLLTRDANMKAYAITVIPA